MTTPQSEAWRGAFGAAYTDRNKVSTEQLAARKAFWHQALRKIDGFPTCEESLKTVIEIGAGDGTNLVAMHQFMRGTQLVGLEINDGACEAMAHREEIHCVMQGDILDMMLMPAYNLVFTRGVLIHIAPENLAAAYRNIHRASLRYILLAEYYAPQPTPVRYRGSDNLLWRNDYAGQMLDQFDDLRLIDYGFVYHRDRFPQDDISWFLMEKQL